MGSEERYVLRADLRSCRVDWLEGTLSVLPGAGLMAYEQESLEEIADGKMVILFLGP